MTSFEVLFRNTFFIDSQVTPFSLSFTFTFTFTFSRRFYSKRLTYVYTFYIYTDGTLHIRSNWGFSVLLKDTSTGSRTSNLLITNRLLYLLYHCRPSVSLCYNFPQKARP